MAQSSPSLDALAKPPVTRLQDLERKALDDHGQVSDKSKTGKQWNSLVPIHRLPSEILLDIFLLLLVDHHAATLSTASIHERYMSTNLYGGPETVSLMPQTQSPYSMAIAVATTCSHWYQLALSTSRLWSYLESTYPLELTEVLLDRSKQAPLHISFLSGCSEEHELGFVNLITSHMHRWASIETSSRKPDILQLIDSKGYSAPLLERYICRDFSSVESVPSFVLERSPKLRELHIATMVYSLQPMSLSGLTDLSVVAWTDAGEPFTAKQFQLLLTGFPLLRTVFIRGIDDDDDDDDLQDDGIDFFEVPNLESISFHNMGLATVMAILLFIIPKQGLYPSLKVVGQWHYWRVDAVREFHADSLIETIARVITWVSLKDASGNGDYRLVTGQESCGVRSTLLDFPVVSDVSAWQSVRTIIPGDNSSLIEDMELLILYPDDHDWVHMASKLRLLPCLKHLTIIFNDEPEYAASYLVNALYLRVLRENSAEQLLLPQLKRLTVRGGCDLEYLATLMRRKHEEEDTIDTYLGLEKLEVQLLVGEEDGDPLITEISSYFQALNIVFENIIPSSAM